MTNKVFAGHSFKSYLTGAKVLQLFIILWQALL
jgi:hypothetical protein